MPIQRVETQEIMAWNADTRACETRSLTYFSVGGATFWLATDSTNDAIISAAYRCGASEANETPSNDMTPERAAALIETNTQTIATLRTVAIPNLIDGYTIHQTLKQITRLERQSAYARRFTA